MARRKWYESNIRTIQNSKGTYYLTLPIEQVWKLGWRKGQKLVVSRDGQKLVIKDWKK